MKRQRTPQRSQGSNKRRRTSRPASSSRVKSNTVYYSASRRSGISSGRSPGKKNNTATSRRPVSLLNLPNSVIANLARKYLGLENRAMLGMVSKSKVLGQARKNTNKIVKNKEHQYITRAIKRVIKACRTSSYRDFIDFFDVHRHKPTQLNESEVEVVDEHGLYHVGISPKVGRSFWFTMDHGGGNVQPYNNNSRNTNMKRYLEEVLADPDLPLPKKEANFYRNNNNNNNYLW